MSFFYDALALQRLQLDNSWNATSATCFLRNHFCGNK